MKHLRRTRDFVSRHGDSRFRSLTGNDGELDATRIMNFAGWKDANYYYVQTDTWRNELHKGADAQQSARHIDSKGLLKTESGKRLTFRMSIQGRRDRVYAVSKQILEIEDD